ncbi:PilW family protein [Roseateles sp. BYS180W]|uniref:PilW family protein n=1 Tax=Roseateles rivi TaxID=3299028 RepID=A0ABW7FTA3_9BURK
MSLISLMVGAVISMLAVTAALLLYKQAGQQVWGSNGTVRSAQLDGQTAAALLSAQNALQGAGFGLAAPTAAEHLVLLSGPAYDTTTRKLTGTVVALGATPATGAAVLWSYKLSPDDAVPSCMGLLSDERTRSLALLQANATCSSASANWSSLTWTRQWLIAPNVATQAVQLSVHANADCWPFGAVAEAMSQVAPPSAKVSVTLQMSTSVAGSANSYLSCLSNFQS